MLNRRSSRAWARVDFPLPERPVNQTRALLWPLRQWRSDCWMLPWNGKMLLFIGFWIPHFIWTGFMGFLSVIETRRLLLNRGKPQFWVLSFPVNEFLVFCCSTKIQARGFLLRTIFRRRRRAVKKAACYIIRLGIPSFHI